MADQRDREIARLFREANQQTPPTEEPSFLDDPEFMSRWQAGGLSVQEHDDVMRRLARDADVRRRLAALIRAGVFTPPEVDDSAAGADGEADDATPADAASPASPEASSRSWLTASWMRWAAAAAALLVIVAAGLAVRTSPARQLAAAREALDDGRTSDAFRRLEKLQRSRLPEDLREDASQLWESVAYRHARDLLESEDFDDAIDAVEAASDVETGRLANLRLQALRQAPFENSLKESSSIFDFVDATPDSDADRFATLDRRFQSALSNYQDAQLKDNYLHFLLTRQQFHRARAFAAESIDGALNAASPDDQLVAHAAIGAAQYGLALASRAGPAESRRQLEIGRDKFQSVLSLHPNHLPSLLGAALCHHQLGDEQRATELLDRASQVATSERERESVVRLRALLQVD